MKPAGSCRWWYLEPRDCTSKMSHCPRALPALLPTVSTAHHRGKPNPACLQVQWSRLAAAPSLAPGCASEEMSPSIFSLLCPVGCRDPPQKGTQATSQREHSVHGSTDSGVVRCVKTLKPFCMAEALSLRFGLFYLPSKARNYVFQDRLLLLTSPTASQANPAQVPSYSL